MGLLSIAGGRCVSFCACLFLVGGVATAEEPRSFAGIYPHLAAFNTQGECGTGAVIPWADRLWWITYAPHQPRGSDDKLYSVDESLGLTIHSESVGGTPANRMIHRESEQLLIGPYVIDRMGKVRVLTPTQMPGRLTGTARHLTDPANKVYYATMEEGFYEVDVRSLKVKQLFPDANFTGDKSHGGKLLPGYHGKGLYSGQGRLVYANNGELSAEARTRPDIDSGVLAEWNGADDWRVVRRNQFTEVTGPGGIMGNADAANDPLWSVGWDHRSLLLMCLDRGVWRTYRLPKASHCYDGAHGWNTEWPRIREIGDGDLLMTMHGQFWRFPRTFSHTNSAGIAPRSSYLKIVGDFCRWGDRLVLGCDDAAKNEFLNTRKAKGKVAGPAQSQSNLWFVEPAALDRFGPVMGRGAVVLRDPVHAGKATDPFSVAGFDSRLVHLVNHGKEELKLSIQYDYLGNNVWTDAHNVTLASGSLNSFINLSNDKPAAWLRIVPANDGVLTAWFELRGTVRRTDKADARFAGLQSSAQPKRGALVLAGSKEQGLRIVTGKIEEKSGTLQDREAWELRPNLSFQNIPADDKGLTAEVPIPRDVVQIDGDSVLYIDDDGKRYRLPIGDEAFRRDPTLCDRQRTSREVATERDLFQAAGTFYELPARNAGGFAKIRPIATSSYFIPDYCNWRGLLVLTGVDPQTDNPRIVADPQRSVGVWMGTIDDLWELGKPRGTGGPWNETPVKAGEWSDPFLIAGFDRKQLTLSQTNAEGADVTIRVQLDITGDGMWVDMNSYKLSSGKELQPAFDKSLNAYWIRFATDRDVTATARLKYD